MSDDEGSYDDEDFEEDQEDEQSVSAASPSRSAIAGANKSLGGSETPVYSSPRASEHSSSESVFHSPLPRRDGNATPSATSLTPLSQESGKQQLQDGDGSEHGDEDEDFLDAEAEMPAAESAQEAAQAKALEEAKAKAAAEVEERLTDKHAQAKAAEEEAASKASAEAAAEEKARQAEAAKQKEAAAREKSTAEAAAAEAKRSEQEASKAAAEEAEATAAAEEETRKVKEAEEAQVKSWMRKQGKAAEETAKKAAEEAAQQANLRIVPDAPSCPAAVEMKRSQTPSAYSEGFEDDEPASFRIPSKPRALASIASPTAQSKDGDSAFESSPAKMSAASASAAMIAARTPSSASNAPPPKGELMPTSSPPSPSAIVVEGAFPSAGRSISTSPTSKLSPSKTASTPKPTTPARAKSPIVASAPKSPGGLRTFDPQKVLELNALLSAASASSGSVPAETLTDSVAEIWSRVAEGDEWLPGDWDESVQGALDAARRGEVGTCAYLAAKCFQDGGADALTTVDSRSLDALWHLAVDPVVVEVPLGQERLWVEDSSGKADWVFTDQLNLDPADLANEDESNFPVRVKGKGERGTAVLPKGLYESAECFHVGATVDLSQAQWSRRRLRRVVLNHEQRLQLRSLVTGKGCQELPEFLRSDRRGTQYAYVSGVRYHVLAYPLAGDLTKALLRPSERSWPVDRRKAILGILASLGETLVSQSAKSGHWDVLAALLKAGLPVPCLNHEFLDICGSHQAARRRWARELATLCTPAAQSGSAPAGDAAASLGSGSIAFAASVRPALLDLAATGPKGGQRALRAVVAALQARGDLPAVDAPRGDGRPSMLVELAGAGRWDLLKVLVEETAADGTASVAAVATSALATRAPPDVASLVQSRFQQERLNGKKSRTLQEYFERLLIGEVLSEDAAPLHANPCDENGVSLLELGPRGMALPPDESNSTTGVRVLSVGVWLGGVPVGSGCQVAFVKVSDQEVQAISAAVESGEQVLPLDVCWSSIGRRERRMAVSALGKPRHTSAAALAAAGIHPGYGDSTSIACDGTWLAVLCPPGCMRRNDGNAEAAESAPSSRPSSRPGSGKESHSSSEAYLRVPRNCVPTLYVQRQTVCVTTVTPCCGQPVGGVLLQFNGKRAGVTGFDGTLRLALPPGQYVFTAPDHSASKISAEVELGPTSQELHVQLPVSGKPSFFIQDMSGLEGMESEQWVMLCGNAEMQKSEDVPCKDFSGVYTIAGRESAQVDRGQRCGDAFRSLQVHPSLAPGLEYRPNEEFGNWLDVQSESDTCILQQLWNNTIFRFGKLVSTEPSPQARSPATARTRHPGNSNSPSRSPVPVEAWQEEGVVRTRSKLRDAYLPAPGEGQVLSCVASGGRKLPGRRNASRQPARRANALQHHWLGHARAGSQRRLEEARGSPGLPRPRSTPALRKA